jgi:RNA polymerase sigma-70 factor (ECF subfamily)
VKAAPRGRVTPAEVLSDLDTQLMLQARSGDRDAANTLVRRNFERISRYIARLVTDRRSVEDLTQDVFLRALSRAEQYRPTAKVTTWLYRIATNCSLNHISEKGRRRQAPDAPEGVHEPPDRRVPTPDQQLNLDELRGRVNEAIDGLPINQRIALTLFEYEQCSYEQIAAILDVTVEAVRSLLMRARTTLRRELRGLI